MTSVNDIERVLEDNFSAHVAAKINENGAEFCQVMYDDLLVQSQRALGIFLTAKNNRLAAAYLQTAARILMRASVVATVAGLQVENPIPTIPIDLGERQALLDMVRTQIPAHIPAIRSVPGTVANSPSVRELLNKEITRLLLSLV